MANHPNLAGKFMRSQRNIMLGIATALIILLGVTALAGRSYVDKEAVAIRVSNAYKNIMGDTEVQDSSDGNGYRETAAAYLSSEVSEVPGAPKENVEEGL